MDLGYSTEVTQISTNVCEIISSGINLNTQVLGSETITPSTCLNVGVTQSNRKQ